MDAFTVRHSTKTINFRISLKRKTYLHISEHRTLVQVIKFTLHNSRKRVSLTFYGNRPAIPMCRFIILKLVVDLTKR